MVRVDAAHLSGLKALVSHWRVSAENVGNFLSHSTGKLAREPFWYSWRFLVFLENSGAAYLSSAKILVSRRGIIKKYLPEEIQDGALLVFLVPKNYAKLGYHHFSKSFSLTVLKYFVVKHFCVFENFWLRSFVTTCLCLA